MYLLILESIGTSELILVGLIALIIFGPRKLPEMMRTIGKAMAEFRRSTNEFKQSWEKEVSLEDFGKIETENKSVLKEPVENSIGRISPENEIVLPEIKEMDTEKFQKTFPPQTVELSKDIETAEAVAIKETKSDVTEKRDWL